MSITGDGDMGHPSKHVTSFGGEFWDNCCKTSTKKATYYVEVGGFEVRFAGRFANLNTWHFDVSMLLCSQF